MPYQKPKQINILGSGISAINMSMTLNWMAHHIEQHKKTYIVVAPVSTVMHAYRNSDFRRLINGAGLITPDGMPLVYLSRWMGHKHVERVYGPDLMLAFSQLSSIRGYTHFYYGGASDVPQTLKEKMQQRFPNLHVVGTYSPPFRELKPKEAAHIVNLINDASPDIVWVGLGSPKQEWWMGKYRAKLNAPILIGVGAAFNFHTGRLKPPPAWMQQLALEWVYRIYAEPRLWRRYIINNPLFIALVLIQCLKLRKFPLDHI